MDMYYSKCNLFIYIDVGNTFGEILTKNNFLIYSDTAVTHFWSPFFFSYYTEYEMTALQALLEGANTNKPLKQRCKHHINHNMRTSSNDKCLLHQHRLTAVVFLTGWGFKPVCGAEVLSTVIHLCVEVERTEMPSPSDYSGQCVCKLKICCFHWFQLLYLISVLH